VPGGTGEPPARVPHAKTFHRNIFAPLLRVCKERDFAPCAERPKVSPLDSTAFEKAGETLNVVAIYFFAICAKSMSGGPGCFYYKEKAAIRCARRHNFYIRGFFSA
jgi:hypothetical protein